MSKKFIYFFIILILIILVLFMVKKNKTGNNNINQDNVKDIFNMSEYEAEIEVTIKSNKNENKYKIKQQYSKSENKSTQELIEPQELKGIKIIKENNKITIENTELNLSKIFENYNGIAQNDMDLDSFIKDFENNKEESNIQEEENKIKIETISKNDNKYAKNKILYIDKGTGKPISLEIRDINKKIIVYIVYNMVELKY